MTKNFDSEQLKSFVDRIERLTEERDSLSADLKEVYSEADGTGFDKAIVRQVIAARKKERDNAEKYKSQRDLFQYYWDNIAE